jgi:hypothetical protein
MSNNKKRMDTLKDYASMAKGVAETFVLGGDKWRDSPEKRVDYGEGPKPESQKLSPPKGWYRSYGRYAIPEPTKSYKRRSYK